MPLSNFNDNSAKATYTKQIIASDTIYTFTENIMSDERVIYRTVAC